MRKSFIYLVIGFLAGIFCVLGILYFFSKLPVGDLGIGKDGDGMRLPTITEATELVKKEWPDFANPKCNEGESVCPKLNVAVKFGKDGALNYVVLEATVAGYGDDSYIGNGRMVYVEWVDGKWEIKDSTKFVLCRNGMFKDTGKVVCQ